MDTRDFMTREKAVGDIKDILDPHFGKNSAGVPITKMQGPAGPSDIFNSNVDRKMDTRQKKGKKDKLDPVTLKALKYNNSFLP